LQADSKPVSSNQSHVHPKLPTLVRRYLSHASRKPVAAHNQQAFEVLKSQLRTSPRPLVLDSFCGTGHSTVALALKHPEHLVVGVDKSAHRLAKTPENAPSNTLLLQAECEDIWRLLLQEGLSVEHHYLLYPNPWPKSAQLQRRIHGDPGFASLLALGGNIELRSNWKIYVEEFGVAMFLAGHMGQILKIQPEQPLTLFERKYQASGHDLWAYRGRLEPASSRVTDTT
jgi:tRNA (guanine-N7-)-methyltransferase